MNYCDKYVLNKDYKLCNDSTRAMLVSNQGANKNINIFIHPSHAVLLSIFNGDKTFKDAIETISDIFSISINDALNTVLPFIENKAELAVKFDGNVFYFPARVLVKAKECEVRNELCPDDFLIAPPYDFNTPRANYPRRILFVINLNCATDCFYCYANKGHKCSHLSTERVCSIIDEAKSIGVVSLELSGGEILLHPDWEIILRKLVDCGYNPYISTKVPVKEDTIKRLKEIGICDIQISIDSLDEDLLIETLNVNHTYAENIKSTIRAFDKYGFAIVLKSTLTKKTCNCENVKELLDFASSLQNIHRYTCSSVGFSQYKGVAAFKKMIPVIDDVKKVEAFIKNVAQQYNFEILDDLSAPSRASVNDYKRFKKRGFCSGNLTSFVVLPDGKVTICEELYWNENFIIGDLSKMSIMDVWNSNKAKSLSSITQCSFPNSSPCRECRDFEKCRHERGVCWKDIIAAYGNDNWLLPDPRCPFAPQPINDVFYD
ncbi:MAG: radical SAM protein [Prevotella sp.]|nr:radical SAM protein [Prevotella sp.]